ncbi:CCCH zinc finger and SMR domain-containing protein [Delitschia confertaspora ATCC 74209]|uniref:CCCH zinc finger and SMR domain-containing protein n=1 Tax=Delitschia confertaspora ATCC 74209 TaxID=1513339 RepID=A0A9P4JSU5_9PLEO|nr:CCCH zinc finger and SMR domain-containing protein [Delitschia confertaspora ATCC 74209]
MVADEIYDICLPVLQDETLEDDDKTDKLEDVLRKETSLTGKPLENIVLDCLWRFRDANTPSSSPPPSRHTVIRRPSPAPWQVGRAPTPVSHSPRIIHPPPGFGVAPPAFNRALSSTASPFTSPRPSPRLALATPHIPHSPSLSAYQFSEGAHTPDIYGDIGSDTVDWLVNDDSGSVETSFVTGDGTLNAAAAEWVQPQTMDMGPYDMLRSILRDDRPDDEIEKALEANGYDFTATLVALMGAQMFEGQQTTMPEQDRTVLVGKSMSPAFRPATPAGQAKSNIVCKYFLSAGHCARADCRFSHDTTKTLCKYFMNGNCLAGETCLFSHDPSALLARMGLADVSTPPLQAAIPHFQMQDYENFPSLQATGSPQWTSQLANTEPTTLEQLYGLTMPMTSTPPPGLSPFPNFTPGGSSRPHSRPSSRHHSRTATPSLPSVDDNEAFPTLGSAAAAKAGKRHHGKRGGHGHNNHKENSGPNNLADVVRMAPSPTPSQIRRGLRVQKSFNGSRENSIAAQSIPAPEHIPWLETGENANKAYLQARAEAFKHGSLRNKFLQSAAQAWNRSDSRAAKALSLRGQTENNLMREAHREAARILYEERNKDSGTNTRELYVDLHGLHPEEAVSYLEGKLLEHKSSSRPIYAITGTGHHSKNGKDKVGKAIRGFLNEWRYVFREFSVPGDRNNVGGILGIDPSSFDKTAAERSKESEGEPVTETDVKKDTKVTILKRDDMADVPKGPRRAGL